MFCLVIVLNGPCHIRHGKFSYFNKQHVRYQPFLFLKDFLWIFPTLASHYAILQWAVVIDRKEVIRLGQLDYRCVFFVQAEFGLMWSSKNCKLMIPSKLEFSWLLLQWTLCADLDRERNLYFPSSECSSSSLEWSER